MEPTASDAPGRPRGYLSEEARRSFTLAAGLLGVVFFALQFLVPMVAMLIYFPLAMKGMGSAMRTARVENAVCALGAVWYVEDSDSPFGGSGDHQRRLLKIVPGAAEPEVVTSLEMENPRLLADGPSVWSISPEKMVQYVAGRTLPHAQGSRLGDISSPFLLDNYPAVFEQRPGRLALLGPRPEWTVLREFSSKSESEDSAWVEKGQFFMIGPQLHIFMPSGRSLFHRTGIVGPEEGSWESIAEAGGAWKALDIGGKPAVLIIAQDGFQTRLRGLKREANQWTKFLDRPLQFTGSSLGACTLEGNGRDLAVLLQSLPGSLRLLRIRDGSIVSEKGYGSFFFPFKMFATLMPAIYILPAAASLLLALILSALMGRYRPDEYTAGSRRAVMASLSQRAIAEVVDALILLGPALAGYGVFFKSFSSIEEGFSFNSFFAGFGLVLAGLFWALVGTVLFSFLEGRWGRTPGKWMVGIQVLGTDLQPCGFVRGLVRNLLKVVDGFFNFMVGILVTALSENWQRIGDMAARTVVIRAPRSH